MKTLAPNSEKDNRRYSYGRSNGRQDHGTRGTKATPTQAWNHEKDPYADSEYQRLLHRKAGALINANFEELGEALQDAKADRLKRVADAMLAAAGFTDQEPKTSIIDETFGEKKDAFPNSYSSDKTDRTFDLSYSPRLKPRMAKEKPYSRAEQ